jgi:cytochrome P450
MSSGNTTGTDQGVVGRFDAHLAPSVERPGDPESVIDAIFDPARRGELYPLYHELRAIAPVHRTEHRNMRGVWFLTRFADVLEVYRNPRAVSDPKTAEHFNHGGQGGPFYRMLKEMMLFLESEQHAHVRRIAVKAFTPRAIAAVRPITQHYADEILDTLAPAGEMDLVAEFAYRLPFRVIAHVLGVPESDFPLIERHAYDFARGSELAVEANARSRRADDAALAFADYFGDLVERRRADPGDDVISALIAAHDDGQALDRTQLVATTVLLMQAGHETTTDSIGNAVLALLRDPAQLDLLRRRPELTKGAVEELLRFDSTNQVNNRLLLDDTTVGGITIPAGDQVALVIGAANRDPAQFTDPDRVDLERQIALHLAFAFGAYYCIGNALARTELAVALRTLVDRFPRLAPAGETFTWRSTYRNRGLAELRVRW